MCGVCRSCGSRELHLEEVTGPAVVYSVTINHQPWMPGMERPFGIVLAEFPEVPSVRLLGWVAEQHLDRVAIGDTLALEFRTTAGGEPIPVFRPVDG